MRLGCLVISSCEPLEVLVFLLNLLNANVPESVGEAGGLSLDSLHY